MQITSVHFTFKILIMMLGMNMQERIKLAYTVALAQVPRLLTLNRFLIKVTLTYSLIGQVS